MMGLTMNRLRLEFLFGVPALAGKRLNVEGVRREPPALKKFPAPQAIDAQPAKAGTPNLSGSWPVTCSEPVKLAGPKAHAASHGSRRPEPDGGRERGGLRVGFSCEPHFITPGSNRPRVVPESRAEWNRGRLGWDENHAGAKNIS
jgi:hypothetical protein